MERDLVKNAESVMKKMTDKTGVQYVDDDNYKLYLEEVIGKLRKKTPQRVIHLVNILT